MPAHAMPKWAAWAVEWVVWAVEWVAWVAWEWAAAVDVLSVSFFYQLFRP